MTGREEKAEPEDFWSERVHPRAFARVSIERGCQKGHLQEIERERDSGKVFGGVQGKAEEFLAGKGIPLRCEAKCPQGHERKGDKCDYVGQRRIRNSA